MKQRNTNILLLIFTFCKQTAKSVYQLFAALKKFFVLGACIAVVSGCAQLGVEPWVKPYERQNLSDPIMNKNNHTSANKHAAHVYEARESARGAEGVGGGGCGCN